MKVIDYIKSLDATSLAIIIEKILSNCECWGSCPLDRIAPFCNEYYGCTHTSIREWLNTDVDNDYVKSLKGGDESDET